MIKNFYNLFSSATFKMQYSVINYSHYAVIYTLFLL